MGSIRQFERRAIEAAYHPCDFLLERNMRYFLLDSELSLIGVSRGEGTCSDLHGVDVAVFSGELPQNPQWIPSVYPVRCQGVVLLRRRCSGERDEDIDDALGQENVLAAMEIRPSIVGGETRFAAGEKRKLFVVLA